LGLQDGVVKIWDFSDFGNVQNTLLINAHSEPVRTLLIDGAAFFSGGYDFKVKVCVLFSLSRYLSLSQY
jgi:WD40 repeat protein